MWPSQSNRRGISGSTRCPDLLRAGCWEPMQLIASLDVTLGFVLYVVLWSFLWEGGKASLVLFISLLFLMKNMSFATFGSSNLLQALVRELMLHFLVFWIHPFGFSLCEAALFLSLPFPSSFSQDCSRSGGACVCVPAFTCLQTPVFHPDCLSQGELVPVRNLHYWEISLWLSDTSLLLSFSVLSLLSVLSSPGDSAGAAGVCAALSLVYPVY